MILSGDIRNKLHNVPWGNLEPQNVIDIPSTLEKLVYEEGKDLSGYYSNLVEACVHNLELNECAFYIIPFLLEILKSARAEVNDVLLELIYEILLGSAPTELTIKLGVPSEQHGVFDYSMVWDIPLKIACRNIIAMGIPLYLELMKVVSLKSKKMIIFILSEFPEFEKLIVPTLKQMLKQETNKELQLAMKEAINDLKK